MCLLVSICEMSYEVYANLTQCLTITVTLPAVCLSNLSFRISAGRLNEMRDELRLAQTHGAHEAQSTSITRK